jgi:hypothetical protein
MENGVLESGINLPAKVLSLLLLIAYEITQSMGFT